LVFRRKRERLTCRDAANSVSAATGHNTFFTNSTRRDDELKTMIAFLRRHLGA
jgi:hypothetical protein